MDQSLNDMKAKRMRTTLTGIFVGLIFCTLAAQTYCSRAKVVGANRVRVEVCQLDLRPDSTYLWVFTNYTSSILGRVKECNRMRSDTTIGSYSLSGDVIQFFQELPEVRLLHNPKPKYPLPPSNILRCFLPLGSLSIFQIRAREVARVSIFARKLVRIPVFGTTSAC